jgi:hypothetical protein
VKDGIETGEMFKVSGRRGEKAGGRELSEKRIRLEYV